MNFTARGYAELNHRLNPHIAVLEGGYSIEGALPYVNLGIILAMAGLDYSNVKEPDFDEKKLRQSPQITEYIKRLCEDIYERWKHKEQIARELLKGKDYIVRQRHVYYDTDGIMEYQTRSLRFAKNVPASIL